MRLLTNIAALAVLALLSCGTTTASAGDDRNRRIVVASFSFPPLLHLADDGSFSGTMGETVKALCDDAKIDCTFNVVPLERAYNELRKGAADALVTLDLGQFNDCCLASAWKAHWSAGLFSSGAAERIPSSEEDMIGKGLIVVNGMRSPYAFLPRMDEMAAAEQLRLFKAKDIRTAVIMFARKRAELLWGGEDFRWYLKRIAPSKTYAYRPLFRKNVVLWVRKERGDTLDLFNRSYEKLVKSKSIGADGLLTPHLMDRRYKDHSLN